MQALDSGRVAQLIHSVDDAVLVDVLDQGVIVLGQLSVVEEETVTFSTGRQLGYPILEPSDTQVGVQLHNLGLHVMESDIHSHWFHLGEDISLGLVPGHDVPVLLQSGFRVDGLLVG